MASVDSSAGAVSVAGDSWGRLLPKVLPASQSRPHTSSATSSASIVT